MTTVLEIAARAAWITWAAYRGFHVCSGCGEAKHCGRARPSQDWLCLDCFDLRSTS